MLAPTTDHYVGSSGWTKPGVTAHTVTLTHTHTLTQRTHTRITHTHTHSTLTPLVLHGDSLHTQLVLNPRTRQDDLTYLDSLEWLT